MFVVITMGWSKINGVVKINGENHGMVKNQWGSPKSMARTMDGQKSMG